MWGMGVLCSVMQWWPPGKLPLGWGKWNGWYKACLGLKGTWSYSGASWPMPWPADTVAAAASRVQGIWWHYSCSWFGRSGGGGSLGGGDSFNPGTLGTWCKARWVTWLCSWVNDSWYHIWVQVKNHWHGMTISLKCEAGWVTTDTDLKTGGWLLTLDVVMVGNADLQIWAG